MEEPVKKRRKSESNGVDASSVFRSHAASLLEKMTAFRESRDLTDVRISAGGCSFEAHRLVLAAASPYFAAMFAGGMNETTLEEVKIEDVDGCAMETLLNYAYTAEVLIEESTVQSVLSAARRLQLDCVVEHCCRFIVDRLNAENCLGILQLADLHSCASLARTAWTYALGHFEEVSCGDEFCTLDCNMLFRLLAEDNLNSVSEESVFNAAIRWVEYDRESRSSSIADLLKHVRLSYLPWPFIVENVLTNDVIASREDCQSIIEEVKVCHFTKKSGSRHLRPRNSFSSSRCIYIVGGEERPSRRVLNTVSSFKPETCMWKSLAPMATGRRGVGVVIFGDTLYAIGGSDGRQALRSVEVYNPEKDTWFSKPAMIERRSSVACAVVNDEIYAIGGHDGYSQCLLSVEKYTPTTGTWSDVSSMLTRRSMLGVAVVEGTLFAIGGYDGLSDTRLCEKYDVARDCWSPIASMQSCRCLAAVAAQNETVVVAGGTNQSQIIDSVEVYNVKTDAWMFVTSLNQPRIGASLSVFGQDLYIIGGQDDLPTVDRYDAKRNEWVIVIGMESNRRRFGCCCTAS